jgi:indolepyruvate ferredoxin oxidoreductase
MGRTAERKMERQLIADYAADVDRLLATLTAERLPLAVKIAQVPQQIRGFGHVKEASVGPAMAERKRLWAEWETAGELVAA